MYMWKEARNRLIIETDSYKYLGVELENRLTFKQFKARILDKARKSRTRVWNMGMKQGALSVKASINLLMRRLRTTRLRSSVQIGVVALRMAAVLLGTVRSPQAKKVKGMALLKSATRKSQGKRRFGGS